MTKTQILTGALLFFPALAPFVLDRMRQGLLEATELPVKRLQRLLRAQRSLLNFSLCLVTMAFMVAVPHSAGIASPNWLQLGSAALVGGLLAGWCAGATLYVCLSAEGQWNGLILPRRAQVGQILGACVSTAAAIVCSLLLCDVFWTSATYLGERLLDFAPLMLVTFILVGMLWGPSLLARADGLPLEEGPLLDQIRATAMGAGIPLGQVLVDDPDEDPVVTAFHAGGRSVVLSPRLVQDLAPRDVAALACAALAELEARVRWEQSSGLRVIVCGSMWLALWSLILTVAASLEEGRGVYSHVWLAVLLVGASLGLFLLTTLVLRRRRILLQRRAADLAGAPRLYLAAHVQAALAQAKARGGAVPELPRGVRRHLDSLTAVLSLTPEAVSEALEGAGGSKAP